jgi:hypothetical protein
MPLYYKGDNTIAITFVDVLRLLPEHKLRHFNQLRADDDLMELLERRYNAYEDEGGLYMNTDGQDDTTPPRTFYLASMGAIEKVTGVKPLSEKEVMESVVPGTENEIKAIRQ